MKNPPSNKKAAQKVKASQKADNLARQEAQRKRKQSKAKDPKKGKKK